MDVHILFFGTALTVLPLLVAGLLAAMVLLERRAELAPAPADAGRARTTKRDRRARRRAWGRNLRAVGDWPASPRSLKS